MSINIFALESCQLLVWVALALVALLGILHFFFEGEIFDSYAISYFPYSEKKWKKWLYWTVLAAVAVLWVIVVVANHQTGWNDVINFAFLLGFSIVCAALTYCVSMFVMIIVFIVMVEHNRGTINDILE